MLPERQLEPLLLKPYEKTLPDILESLSPPEVVVVIEWVSGKYSSIQKLVSSDKCPYHYGKVYKLLNLPEVKDYLDIVKQMHYHNVMMGANKATDVILDILHNEKSADRDRLSAAKLVHEMNGSDKPLSSDDDENTYDMSDLVSGIIKHASNNDGDVNIQINHNHVSDKDALG